jgi:8-oxo-dGTP diphosphatase
MVYDGGVLTLSDVKAIVVLAGELAGFWFVPPGQVAAMVTPLVARRIAASLDAVAAGTVASLENGHPAG